MYLYFEEHRITGHNPENIQPEIKNVNVLMYPPDYLNSSGLCGFTTITENFRYIKPPRKKEEQTWLCIDQIWVDTEIFNAGGFGPYDKIQKNIDLALKLLEDKKIICLYQVFKHDGLGMMECPTVTSGTEFVFHKKRMPKKRPMSYGKQIRPKKIEKAAGVICIIP